MEGVFIILAVVCIGACVYVVWGKTGATQSVNTTQNKDQVRDALTNFLTHRKYISASSSENLMTFVMDKNASCVAGFFLLCLGLIPGILYLSLGGSTKTLSIQFTPTQSGWNVRIQGQRAIVLRVAKLLSLGSPQAPGQLAPSGQVPLQPGVARQMPMEAPAPSHVSPAIGPATPALGESVSASQAPVATANRYCKSCGAVVGPGLKFCSKCGTQIA